MKPTHPSRHRILRAALLFPLAVYLALFGPLVASLHLCEHLGATFVKQSSIEEHAIDHDTFSHHVTHCLICQQGGSAPALPPGSLSQTTTSVPEPVIADQYASCADTYFTSVSPRSPPGRLA